MSNLSDFTGGSSKPKLITAYTSGTGTYVPTENNARCLVRIQAGGSGGASTTTGGGGGAFVEVVVRVPIAGLAYVVGAGGGVAVAGGLSSFGAITANPGTAATTTLPGRGGLLGISVGSVNATAATISVTGTLSGVSGGQGAESASTPGKQVGFPYADDGFNTYAVSTMRQNIPGNGQGNGSGGDSFYGKGGANGNMPAATAYGAGGGINAAGRGGYIEIWDFGA